MKQAVTKSKSFFLQVRRPFSEEFNKLKLTLVQRREEKPEFWYPVIFRTLRQLNRKPFPFQSDTGSSFRPEVGQEMVKNNVKKKLGISSESEVKKLENDAIKTLFINPNASQEEKEKIAKNIYVINTSSTTQANKTSIIGVGNVNANAGEIALASEHSHIFNFEVGQPAERISPQDKKTGKLTIEDLEKAMSYYQDELGKRVKIIHLDQPTKGDFFYTKDELRAITKWAHAKGIPVSMDVERTVNKLAREGNNSYYDYTMACGIDVVSLGMQKNGGARSSASIVLNRQYLSEPERLEQRASFFISKMGGVTDNPEFIVSGWGEVVKNNLHIENAALANRYADMIADVIVNFEFDGRKVEIQNYPLTTNMVFVKFPREFVNLFNEIAGANEETKTFKLAPDRHGVTRIVTAFDTGIENVELFNNLLFNVYQTYKEGRNEILVEKLNDQIGQKEKLDDLLLKQTEKGDEVSTEFDDQIDKISDEKEVKELLELMIDKVEEASLEENSQKNVVNKINNSIAFDNKVLAKLMITNGEKYHPPYGDDEITLQSKKCIQSLFGGSEVPIVLTSSKAQSISCAMKLLEVTDNSTVLVPEGSYESHSKFGRNIKIMDLDGDYKKYDKLNPSALDGLLRFHNSERGKHVPLITAVFIQQPTSKGYVYTPDEIRSLTTIAHNNGVPVILDLSGLSYHLAKTGEDYKKYTTECGVDACTLGFSGLGGGLSSSIVVLNSKYMALENDNKDHVQVRLNRIVKENGGKQSGSSTLACGWEEMRENDLWKENANKVNVVVRKLITEFKELGIELQNDDPANNVIMAKIPDIALERLREVGYQFKKDKEGFTKIKIHYNFDDSSTAIKNKNLENKNSDSELFVSDLKKSLQKEPSTKMHRTVTSRLQTEDLTKLI